jgi:hypothetical protein
LEPRFFGGRLEYVLGDLLKVVPPASVVPLSPLGIVIGMMAKHTGS